jgi:pSer/pThr/pTyr-binding forkhead associated (FHA) protein
MALILEVRNPQGTTTWHRLIGPPVSLGRGYSNDIILDDPYVDAQHARIAGDEVTGVTIHDLGTVNGVLANGARINTPITVQPGTEVKIGRTTLHFRDEHEAVPPAVVEPSAKVPRLAQRLLTTNGSRLLFAITIGLSALLVRLGNTERSSGGTVFGVVMAVWAFIGLWAGIWALALRGPERRYHAGAHVGVVSAGVFAVMSYAVLHGWLVFFFPDVFIFDALYVAVMLFVLGAVVVGHLAVAGALTSQRRWRAGLGASLGVVLFLMLGALVRDESFSDVPRFPGQLKPISARLVPTHTIAEFVEAVREAKEDADESIKR